MNDISINNKIALFPDSQLQKTIKITLEEDEKTRTIVQKIIHKISVFFYKLFTFYLYSDDVSTNFDKKIIFQGKEITSTHNWVKYKDINNYVKLKTNKIKIEIETEPVTSNDIFTKQQFIDLYPNTTGKCNGGVTYFLSEVLKKGHLTIQNINNVAEKFADGIPFEGVLHHQLYQSIVNEIYTLIGESKAHKLCSHIWEWILYGQKFIEKKQLPINTKLILEGFKEYLIKIKKYKEGDLLNYIKEHLLNNNKILTKMETFVILNIESFFCKGNELILRMALNMQGLKIEKHIVKKYKETTTDLLKKNR